MPFVGPDFAAVQRDLAAYAAAGGRTAADATVFKALRRETQTTAAGVALLHAEGECGTPEERELATLAVAAEAAKAALGPKMAAKADAKTALDEATAALAALPKSTCLQHRTKVRSVVGEPEQELRTAEEDLARAEAMYNETVRPLVSARTSTKLVSVAALFNDEFAKIRPATVADMVRAAEELVNVGALADGAIVSVDVAGAFVPAKVIRKCPARRGRRWTAGTPTTSWSRGRRSSGTKSTPGRSEPR